MFDTVPNVAHVNIDKTNFNTSYPVQHEDRFQKIAHQSENRCYKLVSTIAQSAEKCMERVGKLSNSTQQPLVVQKWPNLFATNTSDFITMSFLSLKVLQEQLDSA